MRSLKSTVSRYYPFYCAQVNQLLEVQKQLHAVLLGSPKGGSEATVATPGSPGGGSAASLRTLLGKAVRAQTEQQRELDALRDQLREERSAAYSAKQLASASAQESRELRAARDGLQAELDTERSDRMESEAASLEREEALEAKVAELEEKERRRLEIEAALAAAEPTPDMPAPSIVVAQAPPPPTQMEGFDMSAGGFSL